MIACSVGRFARQQVIAVSVTDGSERPIGSRIWLAVEGIAWLPDSSGLVMLGVDRVSRQLWQLSYPEGEARRVTNDLNFYSGVSLNADASALVTVQAEALLSPLDGDSG
ncbi:MAG: hypothetical protein WKF84_27405 [Pyrinomonadaceae bacterium]